MSNKRVLIIEDEAHLIRLYTKAIGPNYTIVPCMTIHAARDLLIKDTFDIVICDIHIGAHRATELIWEQYGALREKGTKIVVISGKEEYRAICEQLELPFFLKPVSTHDLRTIVEDEQTIP
jgi:DNA-binding NtrC family response regulator